MLFLSDFKSPGMYHVHKSRIRRSRFTNGSRRREERFSQKTNRRWRQVTRCVGHEIALLSEYAGKITNCSHLESARIDQISCFTKYAEESHNVSRTLVSARRTSLVFFSVRGLNQTKDTALLEVLRQDFVLLRVRGQRLVLGRVYQAGTVRCTTRNTTPRRMTMDDANNAALFLMG